MLLTTVDDETALAREGAARVAEVIEEAVRLRGVATVSLTGGGTPRRLYECLAKEPWRSRAPWTALHAFWGDERHVPPDHKDSNYGMTFKALLSHVPVPAAQIHRMRGEMADATAAAREYEAELRRAFSAAGRDDLTFDLMMLGLGEDAHIASIFPGSEVLQERERRVAAPWVAHLEAFRITLTPPAILDARRILMIVSGANKAEAVAAAIERPADIARWPAQLLRETGERVEWLIDRAAARALRGPRA